MINAAIVGLGWWGQTLVEAVADGSDDIRFVAGTTRTLSDDARSFAAQHDFELRNSYEDIIGDPDIDAVVLVTPHSLHSPQTVAAAGHGKHVFVEKPFALTGVDARLAVAATQKAGVTLGLGYNRRFHPEINKLRDMINAGELGTIGPEIPMRCVSPRLMRKTFGERACQVVPPSNDRTAHTGRIVGTPAETVMFAVAVVPPTTATFRSSANSAAKLVGGDPVNGRFSAFW